MESIGSNLFLQFSTVLVNLKLFHLQTDSYAMHKASDALHSSISDNFDLLMETFSGKYGRIELEFSEMELSKTSNTEIVDYISMIIKYLDDTSSKFDKAKDSDLLTIIDNIKTDMNKFKYLSTLH